MNVAYLTTNTAQRRLYVVATANVTTELSEQQLAKSYRELMEKIKTPDPENPNLWTITVDGRKVWGILDERAGPEGEDLFTILFPKDY
ncbi:MAG: hypothetical protein HOC71_17650 [Candidatus Latescibacteria bacterium]|jgi:hypothetical protein|nr:hypothetical protein [Candidatus Latescibacterota bacterium]